MISCKTLQNTNQCLVERLHRATLAASWPAQLVSFPVPCHWEALVSSLSAVFCHSCCKIIANSGLKVYNQIISKINYKYFQNPFTLGSYMLYHLSQSFYLVFQIGPLTFAQADLELYSSYLLTE
jgi:hypothetical protein